MKILALAFTFLLILNDMSSQNLIPNGSFELVKKLIDEKITTSRAAFDGKVHAWYCPTDVSPDIYLPHPNNANFPDHFKMPDAKDGKHYIGLIVDNTHNFCKNYREYVQVNLKDTLEIGTTYLLEFWVNPKMTHTYNLGVFFSKEQLVNDQCGVLFYTPQLNFKDSLVGQEWTKIAFEITPSQAYTHLTFGNFEKSEKFIRKYCYFDDFRLYKKGTIIADIPKKAMAVQSNISSDDLVPQPIEAPTIKPIALQNNISSEGLITRPIQTSSIETVFNANNIQFEHGKFDLTASSLLELDLLVEYLKERSSLKIMMEGHTDNTGSTTANQHLSTERVKSVLAYMTRQGITPDRIKYKSHGARKPIASNDTNEGRWLNRRVTFSIIQ